MKCNDVRIFFSQIADKSVSTPIPSVDMDFLANNGYLICDAKRRLQPRISRNINFSSDEHGLDESTDSGK